MEEEGGSKGRINTQPPLCNSCNKTGNYTQCDAHHPNGTTRLPPPPPPPPAILPFPPATCCHLPSSCSSLLVSMLLYPAICHPLFPTFLSISYLLSVILCPTPIFSMPPATTCHHPLFPCPLIYQLPSTKPSCQFSRRYLIMWTETFLLVLLFGDHSPPPPFPSLLFHVFVHT